MKKQGVSESFSDILTNGSGVGSSGIGTGAGSSTPQREEKEKYLPLFLRRPISSATEQPTRFTPPVLSSGFGAYGYYAYNNGMGSCWPQPTGPGINEVMMPGGLPTISWLCSCEYCVKSVQEFIAALNNSNGMYAACIASSGPVYNELLASGIHLPSPTTGKLMPPSDYLFGGESQVNGSAPRSSGTAITGKTNFIAKVAATMNGYVTESLPYYGLPMAPNGYMGYGMQAGGTMFYNNNYWLSNMNLNATPFVNGHVSGYSPEIQAYNGDGIAAKDNIDPEAAEIDNTVEEEIDVVGEAPLEK